MRLEAECYETRRLKTSEAEAEFTATSRTSYFHVSCQTDCKSSRGMSKPEIE